MRLIVFLLLLYVIPPTSARPLMRDYVPISEQEAIEVVKQTLGLNLASINMDLVTKYNKKFRVGDRIHEDGYVVEINHNLPTIITKNNICIGRQLRIRHFGWVTNTNVPRKFLFSISTYGTSIPENSSDCESVDLWTELSLDLDIMTTDQIILFIQEMQTWIKTVSVKDFCEALKKTNSACEDALNSARKFSKIGISHAHLYNEKGSSTKERPVLVLALGPRHSGIELTFFPSRKSPTFDKFEYSHKVY